MVKEELLIIIVIILQSVNTVVNLRRVFKSRCTSEVDIERNIQVIREPRTLNR